MFDEAAGPMQSFGFRPRHCHGTRLAYVQLRILLTLLIWNFKFVKFDEPHLGWEDVHNTATSKPARCFVLLAKA